MDNQKVVMFNVPNLLTSMNILCGSVATMLALENSNYMIYSSMLIATGAIFDFFDGMSARLLKVQNPMGKELDSLADVITFGIAPAAIMYQLFKTAVLNQSSLDLANVNVGSILTVFIPMLLVIFSGLRLAKFNVDTRQTESFIGLATPPNAIMLASFPLILHYHPDSFMVAIIKNVYFLIAITLFESIMLVSEFPMFSLKFKSLSLAKNKIRFVFLGLALMYLIVFQSVGIPFIILTYILLSGINNITQS